MTVKAEKRQPVRKGRCRSSKRPSTVDRLDPDEARTVLRQLLSAHPDLVAEAEELATALLTDVSFESVANDVEQALRALDLDDLNGRAGRHRWGYTGPTEATWELLHEALEPFVREMMRLIDLGLDADALETCKGIVAGLYQLRDEKGDELLGWAPDFPAEAAAEAVAAWARSDSGDGKRKRAARRPMRHTFPADFMEEAVPEWDTMLERTLTRG